MALFKGEDMPSIKRDMDELEKREAELQAQAEERRRNDYENSAEGISKRRMENTVKRIHIETFSEEALNKARADLEEAEKGFSDMMEEMNKNGISRGDYGSAVLNSEFWNTKIGVAQEEIRQLEALKKARDMK